MSAEAELYRKGVPRVLLGASFDNFMGNLGLIQACKDWVARPSWCLYLWGGVGAGKSHLSVSVVRYLIEKGQVDCLYREVPDLISNLREARLGRALHPEWHLMRLVTETRFLILDDLGVEKPSDWVGETLYRILHGRYTQALPTLITSNLDLNDLCQLHGDRICSRISAGDVIHNTMDDFRRGHQLRAS